MTCWSYAAFLCLIVALGLGDRRVGLEPGGLALLVSGSFLDAGIPLGLGFANRRVPLHLRGPANAKGLEVSLLVLDVTDREADDLQPHVGHVGGRNVSNLLRKSHAIAVNVLDRHRSQDGALLTFERLQGDFGDLCRGLTQKLLSRSANGLLAAPHFHLRHAIDRNRYAFLGVNPGGVDLEGHHFQRDNLRFLQDWQHEHPAADLELGLGAAA